MSENTATCRGARSPAALTLRSRVLEAHGKLVARSVEAVEDALRGRDGVRVGVHRGPLDDGAAAVHKHGVIGARGAGLGREVARLE